jgi:hypothetical protein
LIADGNRTHVASHSQRSGNAFVPKRKWLPKGCWTEHIGYKGIEQVQGNPSVHEIGQGMKQRNTVAVTTSCNEWADNNLNRSGKSRFGNLMPFNEAFLDECQLAQPPDKGTQFANP